MDYTALKKKYLSDTDIYLFNTGRARKAWLIFGCHYLPAENLHMFVVWAPNAQSVSLVGDFNEWDPDACVMTKEDSGIWYAFVPYVHHGDHYKFAVTGADGKTVWKSDPFAFWSQTDSDTASKVYNEEFFEWEDKKFLKTRGHTDVFSSPMSIYEVHLGSWKDFPEREQPLYREIADSLADYCKDMGYTHIELMPVTEYPFPASWGYQVTGYYAPTSRYGSPDDFKYFVNKMHEAGIGVLMDWVPAHFPKDEHGLARFDGSLLYECKEERMSEHPEWGTLIFDYAMPQVQSFLISSACLFFEKYHIDGIRVDAVSSMLYLDYGRKDGEWTPNEQGGNTNLGAVDFLQNLNEAILTTYPGSITIAEESTSFPLVTYPPDVGGLGFSFKWDMGFMHDTLDYMSIDPYFRSGCHDKLTFSMMYAFSENYILAYSHDEVVHGKCSMLNKMYGDYDQKFASVRTLYGYQFAHPGKKLTFMGSEFGQFIEWDFSKQLDWLLLDYPRHEELQRYMKDLNKIYKKYGALYEIEKSWDGFKWLNVDDNERSSVAFLRTGITDGHGKYLICVSNFTPVPYYDFVIGLPHPGKIKEILNSDAEEYGGSGLHNKKSIKSRPEPFLDMSCSVKLDLPGMSTLYFTYTPEKADSHAGGKKKK